METHIITDTDFIESYYEEGDEIYTLLYGVLYHTGKYWKKDEACDYIYNLIAGLILKQKNSTLQSAKINRWIKALDLTINKLKSFGKEFGVTVPFCNLFDWPLIDIQEQYQLAYDILEDFKKKQCQDIKIIEDLEKAYPIPSMSDLFNNLIDDFNCDPDYQGWVPVLEDEMIRRHLHDSVGLNKTEDYEKNLYHDFVYEDEGRSILLEKESPSLEVNEIKVSDVKRIGVLYYMLKDAIKDGCDDVLIKAISFVVNKEFKKAQKANSSVYKYIHAPNLLINKTDKIDYIIQQLERYSIEIPSELE